MSLDDSLYKPCPQNIMSNSCAFENKYFSFSINAHFIIIVRSQQQHDIIILISILTH